MNKRAVALCVGIMLGSGFVIIYAGVSRVQRAEERAERLDRFCLATRDAIRQDRLAFESGDAAKQEQAYLRFYEGHSMHHNSASIALCLSAEEDLPPIPLGCRLNKDWACLARLAAQIEQQLPQPQ